MKKLVLSFMSALFVLFGCFQITFALTSDESYRLACQYWQNVQTLEASDEVIAYASLGLNASQKPLGEYVINGDYASNIAKTVIALILHGDDPRDYQKVNYVEMLEKCVQDNGAFDKQNTSTYANYQVFGVYALYCVQSQNVEKATDYLVSLQESDGGFASAYGESCDITGWVIEALSLVNKEKYQTSIQNALTYLQAHQDGDATYNDGYGANINTQACVLTGLLTYDMDGVKNGTYNQGNNHPYTYILNSQNTNGSFWYSYAGEDNYYATVQGAQVVGYYQNGSVYKQAYLQYQKLIHQDNNIVEKENKDENIKDTQDKEKNEEKTYVDTFDNTSLYLYMIIMGISGLIYIKGRKYVE